MSCGLCMASVVTYSCLRSRIRTTNYCYTCRQQNAIRLAGSSARFAAPSSATQYQATNRRQSNASAQRRSRETRQTSKADYLNGFDVSIHRPLHAQTFCKTSAALLPLSRNVAFSRWCARNLCLLLENYVIQIF